MTSPQVCCGLRHGVEMHVADTSGRLMAEDVAAFLAEALEHFKPQRDTVEMRSANGRPYSKIVKQGRRAIGTLQLNYPGDAEDSQGDWLSGRLWVDAVAHAYAVADSVVQMRNELAMFRAHDAATGSSLGEVLALLERPEGMLRALELMFEISLKRDRETGVYVPGLTRKEALAKGDAPGAS